MRAICERYLAMFSASERGGDVSKESMFISLKEFLLTDCNIESMTPLQEAVQKNDVFVTSIMAGFLDRADIDATGESGISALHLAVNNGNLAIVEVLVRAGANVNQRSKDGLTPLHFCELSSPSYTTDDPEEKVSLREYKVMKVAEFLVENKADIDSRGNNGETPLHFVAKTNNVHVARLLITRGADVNAVLGTDCVTPLHIAAMYSIAEMAELLIAAGAAVGTTMRNGTTPLHLASTRNNFGTVPVLVDGGAEVNATDEDGDSALHMATWNNNTEIVEFLVSRSADVNSRTRKGYTPLLNATCSNNPQMVRFLVSKGADVELAFYGYTPLHIAFQLGYTEAARALLESGAESIWWRAVQDAVISGSVETVKLVVGEGGRMSDGRLFDPGSLEKGSLLHIALESPAMLRYLLESESLETDCTDYWGQTPLHIAAETGNWKAARLLLRHGADPGLRDDKGVTAFDLATSDVRSVLMASCACESKDFVSECDICKQELVRELAHVDCNPRVPHHFHVQCIKNWIAVSPTCPHCRSPVDSDDLVVVGHGP